MSRVKKKVNLKKPKRYTTNNEVTEVKVAVIKRYTRHFVRDCDGLIACAKNDQRKIMELEAEDGTIYETFSPAIYKSYRVGETFTARIEFFPLPGGEKLPYVRSAKSITE